MAEFLTINATAAQRLANRSSGPQVARKTALVAQHARILAPGSMKNTIRSIGGTGPAPIGIVVCDHPAALFVLKGTNAHDIRPKTKAALAFVPRGGKNKVFAKLVHHPGTKENNFLMKALRSI
jgi:hypothetical protein